MTKEYAFGRWLELLPTLKDPDLYATRPCGSGGWDVAVRRWTNRKALAVTVRMQERRERRMLDWRPVVNLTDGEGY